MNSKTSHSVDNTTCSLEQEFAQLSEKHMKRIFGAYQACFLLLDTTREQYFRYNPEFCGKRMSPCSTFKIFNSLVGLETGVIENENSSMKWDGTEHSIGPWNRDHTLQSAITNSVVWYFQRLASTVGEKRMKEYISKAHFGNEDISGGITQFWLGSTLKISADEQVTFLKALVGDKLPFSKRSMAIVRGLLRLDQTQKGTLYGKTGSDGDNGKFTLGWFVGYVVQPERIYVFATNIQANDDAGGRKARELTEKILAEAGLI
ncbi:MAG: class D beta-lactamase [Candidatus Melainabacteria bacterium]|nr:MAG: class D beta-lactamase [Candidatus Melainabacteria bacterium]